jgi:CubicO group peptidase (beta-lactamase class C family)
MKKNSIIITALAASLLVGCTNAKGTKQDLKAAAPAQKEAVDGKIAKKLSEYWPTKEWKTSLPEQQGMDSGKLGDLLDALVKKNSPIQGLIVIRNGYIVTEKYTGIYNKTMSHAINSVTKSVTFALTGVAIKEGYIKSVNDHVLDYFSDRQFTDSEHKKSITIENLLTMSAGLEWPEIGRGRS